MTLLRNPDSFLGKLVRKVGKSFMEKIIKMAEDGQKAKENS